ncbi:MAG: hypothetical protein R3F30_07045 [Planctomycetota bacterium]
MFAVSVQNQEARLGRGVPARAPHWSVDVLPQLVSNCAQCHFGGNRQGNYAMDSYVELFSGGDFAPMAPTIVAGYPDRSFLFEKVDRRYPGFGVQMPEGLPPLSQSVRAVLAEWIRAGARRD